MTADEPVGRAVPALLEPRHLCALPFATQSWVGCGAVSSDDGPAHASLVAYAGTSYEPVVPVLVGMLLVGFS